MRTIYGYSYSFSHIIFKLSSSRAYFQIFRDWFQMDQPVFVKLNPASKDPNRIIISVRPIYEEKGKISKVIESKNSSYAKSDKGEVFLPFSKLDIKQNDLGKITGERYCKQEVHFWAHPNYQAYAKISPWMAYRYLSCPRTI